MKIWILKAFIQKIISYLPFRHKINYLFQKHVTKGVFLNCENFEEKLKVCNQHIENYFRYSEKKEDFIALELGTGWFPVVPFGIYLCGASKIITLDINPFLKKENTRATVKMFLEYCNSGELQKFIPRINNERVNDFIKNLKDFENLSTKEIFKKCNIVSLIKDARETNIDDNSIDLIVSNNTLEHIYTHVLSGIMDEFKRIAKRGGVMSHLIDMSDHFAHIDKKISIYNFLKFSEERWNLIDNKIQPQNRLRIYDYRNIYNNRNIALTEVNYDKGNVDELNKIKLDNDFISYSPFEVSVSNCSIVSKM